MIDLRAFAVVVASVCLLAAVVGGCFSESGQEEPRQAAAGTPNIVMVLADDQTAAQYNDHSMPFTRRFMREHGTTFTNYMVTSPLCCPARAGIITGQYGHNNGVLDNSYSSLHDPGNVLPVWLQRAGYRTAHVGKFLNNYGKTLEDPAQVTPGWDDWFTQLEPQRYYEYDISNNGEMEHFGASDDDYLTRVLTQHATDQIRSWADEDQPFYLALDYFAPHFGGQDPAGRCRGAGVPDPRDQHRFKNAATPQSPSINEADVGDKPGFIQALPRLTKFRETQINQRYGCALAAMRAVDRGFNELVETLDETDMLANTVIVFSSDNGYFYGEHRIPDDKDIPYRETYEVPLQIRLPGNLVSERMPSSDAEVANIDLAPTFLDLADAEPCGDDECRTLDGRSLLPVLKNGGPESETWPSSRPRGLELDNPSSNSARGGTCRYYGVRSGRWVYVHHVTTALPHGDCLPSDEIELYDLKADPHQLENVAGSEPLISSRLERIASGIRACSGSAAADEEPDSPTGLCP